MLVWRGRINEGTLAQLTEVEERVVERSPRISVVNVVLDTASGEASIALIESAAGVARRFDAAILGSATVVIGGTRVVTGTRMILDGLLVLIGQAERYRLFSRVADAVAWLRKLPQQDTALVNAELAAAVEAFVRESTQAVSDR